MKEKRKIKFEALDPTGVVIGEPIEMSYYNVGYKIPPEECLPGYEPLNKIRYLLTIGEHQYYANRKGEIFAHLTKGEYNEITW